MPLSNDIAGRTENLYMAQHTSKAEDINNEYLPFSMHKEGLLLGFTPTNGPGMTAVCCPVINSAFIHKDELIGMVLANSIEIVEAFFCRAFSGNFCNLEIIV